MRILFLSLFITPLMCGNANNAKAEYLSFECPFNTYERSEVFFELAEESYLKYYSTNWSLLNYGRRELHDKLQSNFMKLELDVSKTPIVMGDPDTGRLSVFYCKEEKCTLEEEMRDAHLHCHEELNVKRCLPFAVKAETTNYCVWQKGITE